MGLDPSFAARAQPLRLARSHSEDDSGRSSNLDSGAVEMCHPLLSLRARAFRLTACTSSAPRSTLALHLRLFRIAILALTRRVHLADLKLTLFDHDSSGLINLRAP